MAHGLGGAQINTIASCVPLVTCKSTEDCLSCHFRAEYPPAKQRALGATAACAASDYVGRCRSVFTQAAGLVRTAPSYNIPRPGMCAQCA